MEAETAKAEVETKLAAANLLLQHEREKSTLQQEKMDLKIQLAVAETRLAMVAAPPPLLAAVKIAPPPPPAALAALAATVTTKPAAKGKQ